MSRKNKRCNIWENNVFNKIFIIIVCFGLLVFLRNLNFKKESGMALFRGGLGRLGVYNTNTKNIEKVKQPRWQKFRTGGKIVSSPSIAEALVYVGSNDGNFYAIDIKSGKEKWKVDTGDAVVSSPVIAQGIVYFGGHDGSLHALRTKSGDQKWRFETEEMNLIDSSPAVSGDLLYFGSFDKNLYALDVATGKEKWRFGTGDIVSSSPAVSGGMVYFGSYDKNLYALEAKTGKERWRFETGDKVLSSPLVFDNVVYFGSFDKNLYALEAATGKEKWRFATGGIVSSSPAVSGDLLYFGSFDKNLYALEAATGKEKWRFGTNGAVAAVPAIADSIVYFGSCDGSFYALEAATGKEKWRFATKGPVTSSAAVINGSVYFGSSDGSLYSVSSETSTGVGVATPNSDTVGLYDIYELTIERSEESLTNPWEDVDLSVEFANSKGEKFLIYGFYYRANIWKVRFAPLTVGSWSWTLAFNTPIYQLKDSGSFYVSYRDYLGFIGKNPNNPLRLVYGDGSLFNGIGLNESFLDLDGNGNPFDNLGLDGRLVEIDDYFKVYGASGAGFNLFRWGIDNASFKLWKTISPMGNYYLVREGLWGDELVQTLRKNGFRLWLTMFGFTPPFNEAKMSVEKQEALKHYIRYVVARYGAYVDVWELMNEAKASDDWMKTAIEYLRSIDPYHRLITTNWERPDLPEIDINSLHWYERESEFDSDIKISQKIQQAKDWGKAVVFSEQGNKVANWDERSAVRMRLRAWTAFFEEAIVIFWNTSHIKGYTTSYEAANIYLGEEERGYIRALQNFTAGVDANIKPLKINYESAGVRAYGLQATSSILGYFHHFTDHQKSIRTNVFLSLPANGSLEWIDPATGKVIESLKVNSGLQTLVTPDFVIDLAFKISLDKAKDVTYSQKGY